MNAPEAARGLRTNFLTAPIGIDVAPLLSWEAAGLQRAYRIEYTVAASTAPAATQVMERCSPESAHQWEDQLEPISRYRWRVQTKSRARSSADDSRWSPWSAWATFETALISESDWRGAAWVGASAPGPAPIMSTTFRAHHNSQLRLYLCGLGIANVTINDKPVGDGVLDPPPSAYDSTIFYRAFNVSDVVENGRNTISVVLGRGYYAMTTPTAFNWHKAPWRSEPKLRALLIDLARPDAPLLRTDAAWSAATTAVLDDSMYTGEVHDFTTPHVTSSAALASPPRGTLKSCQQPPVTRRERIQVVAHEWTGDDRQRFDFAENVAGMATISIEDAAEPTVQLKFGEKLGPNGEVVAADGAIPGELQRSTLVRVPADKRVSLDLTYAGARYAEITGTRFAATVEIDRVSAAPLPVGAFQCSDARLTAIHDAAILTFENCLQGIPVDTPLYEKQGYTGDAQLLAETYAYNYWMPNYLASWLEASVLPSQSSDGSMPGITPTPPENWIFDTPSPAWDAALLELPHTLLRHYDDRATVRRALPTLRRYLAYLDRRFPDGIVTAGLGDWNPPGYQGMPPEHPTIVSTAYYFRFLTMMAGLVRQTGDVSEVETYTARARVVRDRFHAAFWNRRGFYTAPEDGDYRETNNVLPIAFGLTPSPLRERVLARIEQGVRSRDMHLDTGMVGTRFLLRVLSDADRADVAFEIAGSESYPGWLHWIKNGATTLYENWELDGRSHNHAMFGTIEEWFYADVAGISPAADGWRKISVNPHFPSDRRFACRASIETISGPVEAEWDKSADTVRGRVIASSNVQVVTPELATFSTLKHLTRRRDAFTDEHTFEFEPH